MVKADVNFINGNIYTMKNEGDKIEAFSVQNGKIIAAGTEAEIKKIPAEKTIDLKGKTVIPGMQNTHCHLAECAEGKAKVDLGGCKTMDELLERLTQGLNKRTGDWLFAYQADGEHLVENRLPNRFDLDKVSKDVPIFISANSLHHFMCNTKALEVLGITKDWQIPDAIKKLNAVDKEGNPVGSFAEHALLKYINQKKPTALSSLENCKKAMYKTLREFSSYGITTMHTCDGFDSSLCDSISLYQKLEAEGKLPMRVICNRQTTVGNSLGAVSRLGNDKVKLGAVKLFADGSVAQRSAYLRSPYNDKPGYYGIPVRTDAEMLEAISAAYSEGNDVCIHVIGDAAVEQVLNCIEKVWDGSSTQQIQLIHGTLIPEDLIERMAKFPVTVDSQAMFLPNMALFGTDRVGADRARWFFPFKSLMQAGIKVTGGDDGPITNPNPFFAIREAVTRETSFGSGKQFYPEECLSIYEALSMYTKNAAWNTREETFKGTLETGKLADFAILDKNIFTVPSEEISSIKVLETYLGGVKIE